MTDAAVLAQINAGQEPGKGPNNAWKLLRLAQGMLFNISPHDPVTHVVVTVVLGIVALLACWLPARRATRIDPIETLRAE